MVMAFAVPAPNPTSTSSYVPCSLVSNIDFDNEHVATDIVAYIAAMRRRWTRRYHAKKSPAEAGQGL
jgi:hypothetical protein